MLHMIHTLSSKSTLVFTFSRTTEDGVKLTMGGQRTHTGALSNINPWVLLEHRGG